MPSARAAPNRQAVTASTPLPQPTSSRVAPGKRALRTARSDSTVVGWSPSPKVEPGSIRTTVIPSGASNGSHAGTTTRSRSIHDGWAWLRHVSATDGSISTNRHRHRFGNASASRVIASTSSPSEVHSSTRWSSVPDPASRSSTATTPSAQSASEANSASLAGTVTTSPSIVAQSIRRSPLRY